MRCIRGSIFIHSATNMLVKKASKSIQDLDDVDPELSNFLEGMNRHLFPYKK